MPKVESTASTWLTRSGAKARRWSLLTSSPAASRRGSRRPEQLARRYRVIAYNARGYPPSDVPTDPAAYSLPQVVDDLRGLLVALGIDRAHIGGLSMGGGLSVAFALEHPQMCRSIIVCSAGSGSTNVDGVPAAAARDVGTAGA